MFHNYSSNNVALILEQRPTATYVANEMTWSRLGRTVRNGEQPIFVWAPTFRAPPLPAEQAHRRKYLLSELRPGFRHTPIYDITQTEGDPVPQGGIENLMGGAPEGAYGALVEVARQFGYDVYNHDFGEAGIHGETHLAAKAILVSETQHDAHRVKTLVHELGHALLHNGGEERSWSLPRSKAEMEAESVAYVVCHALGMSTERYSAPYAAVWAKGGRQAAVEIMMSASHIKRAARRILAAYQTQARDGQLPRGS